MTKPPSRSSVFRLPRERRVADIMDAARKVFEDKGYDAALISDIAERAQVVEGTIYRYFENKRALLTKVVEHWYAGMLSDYDHELRHIRGTRDRLRFLIWKHLVTVHEEPALCRLVFQVLRVGDGYRSTDVFKLNRAYTRRTIEIIKAWPGKRRVPQRPAAAARARHHLRRGRASHLGLFARRGRFLAR